MSNVDDRRFVDNEVDWKNIKQTEARKARVNFFTKVGNLVKQAANVPVTALAGLGYAIGYIFYAVWFLIRNIFAIAAGVVFAPTILMNETEKCEAAKLTDPKHNHDYPCGHVLPGLVSVGTCCLLVGGLIYGLVAPSWAYPIKIAFYLLPTNILSLLYEIGKYKRYGSKPTTTDPKPLI